MGDAPREMQVFSTNEHLHEESDAQIRPLAIFLGGLAGSLIIVVVLMWLFFDVLLATVNNSPADRSPTNWAGDPWKEPPLQASPRRDLEALRQAEDEKLHATEWIDGKHARIPIEMAMEIVADKGLPKWPPAVPQSTNAAAETNSGARPGQAAAGSDK